MHLTFGSPWKRVGAILIDIVISGVVGLVLGYVFADFLVKGVTTQAEYQGRMNAYGMLIWWLYFAFMESSSLQGTIGKAVFGLKVTDLNGERIGFLRATGRHFGKLLSGVLLLAGFIMAFFTQKKQGLHDMMAGCLVLDANAQNLPATSSGNGRAVAASRPTSTYSTVTTSPVSAAPPVQPLSGSVKVGEPSMVTPAESVVIDEDAIYASIASELKTGATNEGLWIRLFAECDGDENRTKVAYIKQRAEFLISRESVRLAQAMQEQATEANRIAEARRQNLHVITSNLSRILTLAAQHSRNPRMTIDEKEQLLKLAGGSFAWADGFGKCSATFPALGQEKKFNSGGEFACWFSDEVVPYLLSIEKMDVVDKILSNTVALSQISCPYCDASLAEGSSICSTCQRILPVRPRPPERAPDRLCRSCNAVIAPGALACIKCGTPSY